MTIATVEVPGITTPLQIDDDPWRMHRETLDGRADVAPARLTYAAPHVIMHDSYGDVAHRPGAPGNADAIAAHIDWGATKRLRQHLAAHGLGIAEAMDTAQRSELTWPIARRLLEETASLNLTPTFVGGASTDQRTVSSSTDCVDAVVEQAAYIGQLGGIPMIMSMPWLSRNQCDAETYVDVYRAIIDQLPGPLLVHWLGEMFQPALAGYFPDDSFMQVMRIDPSKVRGAKLSLLDADLERRLRAELLQHDQVMLTGDDYHFADLIAGEDQSILGHTTIGAMDVALGRFSHALLGVLDGVAAPAGLALGLLAHDELDAYHEIMAKCEAVGRVVFEPPTQAYKAGLAFINWLNGHQGNPMLINHLQQSRSTEHLVRVACAAADAGALTDARLAAERLQVLTTSP